MSGLGDIANTSGAADDKPEFRTPSIDASKTPEAKYRLDGAEDEEATDDVYSRANPPRPGFTKNDQRDMYRMGKLQEFKVRCTGILRMGCETCKAQWLILYSITEKLPSFICSEFCYCSNLCLGVPSIVITSPDTYDMAKYLLSPGPTPKA